MLWATRETSRQVQLYANDQEAFFKDWMNAHVRMAHVGCESCGVGSHADADPCGSEGPAGHGHHFFKG
jgi:hypothetical protein